MPNNSSNRTRAAKRVVAIDVGATCVRAVEIEARDGASRVVKRGQAVLAAEAWRDLSAHREHLAEAIRVAMRSAGIAPGCEVTTALPRRLVTLKTVQLPPAPPEQIRGMVRFEAPQHMPFPLDEVELGYELLADEGQDMTTVILAAARKSIVADFMAAFERAGVDVSRLSVSSMGLAETLGAGALPIAAVRLDGPDFEVAVVSAGRLLYSRAASAPDATPGDAWLLAQTERTLAAYSGEAPGQPVSKVILVGSRQDVEALQRALGERLGVPCEPLANRLAPANEPEAGGYAVAAGLGMIAPSDTVRLTLVPETRAIKRAATRRRWQQIAATVTLVACLAGGSWWMTKSAEADRRERSSALRENKRLTAARKALGSTRTAHDVSAADYRTLASGLSRTIPVVDMLKAVSDAAPSAAVTLTQMAFERPATVTIQGSAPQASAAMDLLVALRKSPSFSSVRLGYVGDARSEGGSKAAAERLAASAKPVERVTFSMTGIVRAAARPAGKPAAPTAAPAPRVAVAKPAQAPSIQLSAAHRTGAAKAAAAGAGSPPAKAAGRRGR